MTNLPCRTLKKNLENHGENDLKNIGSQSVIFHLLSKFIRDDTLNYLIYIEGEKQQQQ